VYRDVLFISLDTEDPPIALPDPYVEGQRRLEAAMARDAAGTQQMLLQRSRERPEPVRLPGSVAISDQQLAFVERTLADHSDVAWTVLLMHKPAWLYGSEAFAQIEQRMSTRDYTVFAGHEHYYTYEQRAGRDYIDMGTTGGVWLQDGPGRLDHVALVTMTKSGPIVAQLALNGVFDKRGPRPEPAGLTEESPVEAAGETHE
jgi:3',5'-cyclic AMP phosphodiesterase CpdA